MPFYDLNVSWTQEKAELQRTLTFLDELGYNVFALSHTLSGKLTADISCPIPSTLPFSLPEGARVLRRCTLVLSDPAQNHHLKSIANTYDIVALRPVNEKTLHLACTSLECDIISLDLTQRFDFYFGMKSLDAAVKRGIKLEICYSSGISTTDTNARRNFISNTTQLIRGSRGRGLIISSGAVRASVCRAPADLINLATMWGLGPERAKEALCRLPQNAIACAQLKRTSFRGVIDVVYGGEAPAETNKQANNKKRKFDGEQTGHRDGLLPPKPMSKREQKRQQKKTKGDSGELQGTMT
ncbi:MAG: hypothetical protein M1828_004274 [Chrysothrix sp. TS-e1954]|nr:MAG: hypothetical protein M1828_004274 [Chrysothrix sp. TS-e1954]